MQYLILKLTTPSSKITNTQPGLALKSQTGKGEVPQNCVTPRFQTFSLMLGYPAPLPTCLLFILLVAFFE